MAIKKRINHSQIVTVGTSLTDVTEICLLDAQQVGLQVSNLGAVALNALEVQVKFGCDPQSVPWQILLQTSTDYDPTGNKDALVQASGDLTVLGAGEDAWLAINTGHYGRMRIRASVSTGTTDLRLHGVKNV